MTKEEIRVKALELAISGIAAFKTSVVPKSGYGIIIVEAADHMAKYIIDGQVDPPASE